MEGSGGGVPNNCVGKAWTTADPTKAGPFQVGTEKNVGPLAGVVPDPIYGDKQQRFNVYRPNNLADTGYCHPILIWANGFKDNPEQNPPDCIVNQSDRWCGQYSPLLKHLASHGFVVVASLSTATAEGDPLPTIAGLDWILQQSEDSSSPYYHHLDTANIGQLGHSYGGMSTCMSRPNLATRRWRRSAAPGRSRVFTRPMLFFCGGMDGTVKCDGVKTVFQSVTNQPAFFLNEKNLRPRELGVPGSGRRLAFVGRCVVQGSLDERHGEPQVLLRCRLHVLHGQPRRSRSEQLDGAVGQKVRAVSERGRCLRGAGEIDADAAERRLRLFRTQ